jgi:small subunit ribosomal protein S16
LALFFLSKSVQLRALGPGYGLNLDRILRGYSLEDNMVTIRLARGGAKKTPFYRIMVADSRRATNARNIEQIGFYNPRAGENEEKLRLDVERANYWIGTGAKPSDTVAKLLKDAATAA